MPAGGEGSNQDLSERRADSIKRYLVDKYSISGDRSRQRRLRCKSKLKDPSQPMARGEPPRAGRQHGKQDHPHRSDHDVIL